MLLISCTDDQFITSTWKVHSIETIDICEYINNEWVINQCPSKLVLDVTQIYMPQDEQTLLNKIQDTIYTTYSGDLQHKLIHDVKYLSHELNLHSDTTYITITKYRLD